jgi:hypothetical protein
MPIKACPGLVMSMLEKPELAFKDQCIESVGHICPACGAEETHHSGEAEGG